MLKRNLFILFAITLFSATSTILCVSNYDPFNYRLPEFLQFYISFFLSVFGISSILIYFSKIQFRRDQMIYAFYVPSLRQGLLTAICLTITLLLQGLRLLDPWIIVPLVIILVLLELFFQTKGLAADNKNNI